MDAISKHNLWKCGAVYLRYTKHSEMIYEHKALATTA